MMRVALVVLVLVLVRCAMEISVGPSVANVVRALALTVVSKGRGTLGGRPWILTASVPPRVTRHRVPQGLSPPGLPHHRGGRPKVLRGDPRSKGLVRVKAARAIVRLNRYVPDLLTAIGRVAKGLETRPLRASPLLLVNARGSSHPPELDPDAPVPELGVVQSVQRRRGVSLVVVLDHPHRLPLRLVHLLGLYV